MLPCHSEVTLMTGDKTREARQRNFISRIYSGRGWSGLQLQRNHCEMGIEDTVMHNQITVLIANKMLSNLCQTNKVEVYGRLPLHTVLHHISSLRTTWRAPLSHSCVLLTL